MQFVAPLKSMQHALKSAFRPQNYRLPWHACDVTNDGKPETNEHLVAEFAFGVLTDRRFALREFATPDG